MSDEIAKEVLRNSFKQAAKTLTLLEIHIIMTETLNELAIEYMNLKYIKDNEEKSPFIQASKDLGGNEWLHNEEDSHKCREKSDEQDAKEIDDAQRYRDLKS